MEKPDFEHIDENARTFWKEETEKFYEMSNPYYKEIRKGVSKFTFQGSQSWSP